MKLFLSGFMGVGKSTVGQILAHLLGVQFVDLDREIETRSGCSIPALFKKETFRSTETRVLNEVLRELSDLDAVISLGGGTVCNDHQRATIRAAGSLITLEAEVSTLLERLQNDQTPRPLLLVDHPLEAAQALLQTRRAIYDDADLKVSTENRSPEDVAAELAAKFSNLYFPDFTKENSLAM